MTFADETDFLEPYLALCTKSSELIDGRVLDDISTPSQMAGVDFALDAATYAERLALFRFDMRLDCRAARYNTSGSVLCANLLELPNLNLQVAFDFASPTPRHGLAACLFCEHFGLHASHRPAPPVFNVGVNQH